MHILLLILKIIGIILLVLLGILVVLLLLLIFAPFYYRVEGSYHENQPYAMARIRYLFPILQVLVQYKDGQPDGKIKVLGITVYDIFHPKEKSEKPKKKAKKTAEEVAEVQNEESADNALAEQKTLLQEIETENETEQEAEEEKKSLLEKIKTFFAFLHEKILSIIKKCKEIKEKGLNLKKKIDSFSQKANHYYEVWQEDYTQRAFEKAKKTLLKLWKSIRPRKGLAKIHFGAKDPSGTGQICGYFGMLYPFIGKYVMIEPDFEKQVFEGDAWFKGRITVFALLKVVWFVLFDKDIKKLKEAFKD